MEKEKPKYVLCHFCKQKIHIDHLGGVYVNKGKQTWFCDNVICLVSGYQERKKANTLIINENNETI